MSLNADSPQSCEYIQQSKKNDHGENKINLGLIIYESMKKYSNRVFQYIVDTDEKDTYGDALKRSIRTALKLREKGITKDDIISTCSYNNKNNAIPVIASLFIGSKIANFDPSISHLDTIHLLKLVQPKILFVVQECLPFMEKCLKEAKVQTELVVIGHSEGYSQFSEYLQPNSGEDDFKPARVDDATETAVIFFSSGTTGFPKGICLSHYGLFRQTANNEIFESRNENQHVTLIHSTYYGIVPFTFLLRSVSTGSAKVVCSKFDPLDTWKIIEKYKVTTIFMATHFAIEFLKFCQNADTSSLKFFVTGGNAVTKKLMDDLIEALPNTIVLNIYGQTETCGIASFNPLDPEEVAMQIRKPQSCGRVNKTFSWKVVDPTTEQILPPNQKGELRIKSNLFMNGYYKMDSSTAYDSQGYFKTGDLVYYDDDDCIFVIERLREMFKYRGWHIVPAVVEEVIMTHPAVKETVVFGFPHEDDGEHPMALVVLHGGYEHITPNDIVQYVEERVGDIQRLRAGVKIINEMVRTATEKVRRNYMKKMVLDGLI